MSPLCVIAKEAPYVTEAWHYDWDQRSARCMHSLSTSRHRKSWLRSFLLQKTIKLFSQQQHLGNYRNHLRSPVSFFSPLFLVKFKSFFCVLLVFMQFSVWWYWGEYVVKLNLCVCPIFFYGLGAIELTFWELQDFLGGGLGWKEPFGLWASFPLIPLVFFNIVKIHKAVLSKRTKRWNK